MSPLLWNGDNEPRNRNEPPQDDRNDGAFYFVLLTLVMWLVVILGQMFRG